MLSFKRFLYIVIVVAVLGGVFFIYGINKSQPASAQIESQPVPEREFLETGRVDEGTKPRVWLLGDSKDGRCGKIYSNVRQFCENIKLTVAGEGHFNAREVKPQDLVIFCHDSISLYADIEELEEFIADGGRVVLAAGLLEGDEDSRLWPAFGIQEKSSGEDYHDLVFEKPLLPVQPEKAYYDGDSGSVWIKASADASVYIRDAKDDVPILYTYDWQKGGVCLINGSFLTDTRCMGLLTGAMAVLWPDFVYPVLGVKAVFLDNFPMVTSDDDELCRRLYGYSAKGFVRDVVWPAFQGISLRTDTPYTAGVLAAASSEESFGTSDDPLLTDVGKSVLQFGGELVYAADGPEDGKTVLDQDFIDPFSREDGCNVFPAATRGNSIEDGNLFDICSVLGAYGMVSHVFPADMLIAGDGDTAAWDSDKEQISVFESEVLNHVSWLEGRTLSQTGDDVRSYQKLDYGWKKDGARIELHCSGAVKGQAFFYHTDDRIVGAEGLSYQDAGNGYYLLRIQESYGIITLEEGE